jgi:hypothetical protein
MMEGMISSGTSAVTRVIRRHVLKDDILR